MENPFEGIDFNRTLRGVLDQITDAQLVRAIDDLPTRLLLMFLIAFNGQLPDGEIQIGVERNVVRFERLLNIEALERGGRVGVQDWPRSIFDPRPLIVWKINANDPLDLKVVELGPETVH